MAPVLVTGGTGMLGHEVVARLIEQGHTVRILSRSASRLTPESDQKLEWAQAALATGEGVEAALQGIHTVIHCASSPFGATQAVDVDGTARLLQLAQQAGVTHTVYISITGMDDHPFRYYQSKIAAEKIVMASGLPWTILRATQFYDFIDLLLNALHSVPLVMPVPTTFIAQPVHVGEVADHLVAAATHAPAGWLPDVAGPEVWQAGEMAKIWLRARGSRKPIVHLPFPGKVGAAFRSGMITRPDRAVGKLTWTQWLEQKYGTHESEREEQFA